MNMAFPKNDDDWLLVAAGIPLALALLSGRKALSSSRKVLAHPSTHHPDDIAYREKNDLGVWPDLNSVPSIWDLRLSYYVSTGYDSAGNPTTELVHEPIPIPPPRPYESNFKNYGPSYRQGDPFSTLKGIDNVVQLGFTAREKQVNKVGSQVRVTAQLAMSVVETVVHEGEEYPLPGIERHDFYREFKLRPGETGVFNIVPREYDGDIFSITYNVEVLPFHHSATDIRYSAYIRNYGPIIYYA